MPFGIVKPGGSGSCSGEEGRGLALTSGAEVEDARGGATGVEVSSRVVNAPASGEYIRGLPSQGEGTSSSRTVRVLGRARGPWASPCFFATAWLEGRTVCPVPRGYMKEVTRERRPIIGSGRTRLVRKSQQSEVGRGALGVEGPTGGHAGLLRGGEGAELRGCGQGAEGELLHAEPAGVSTGGRAGHRAAAPDDSPCLAHRGGRAVPGALHGCAPARRGSGSARVRARR